MVQRNKTRKYKQHNKPRNKPRNKQHNKPRNKTRKNKQRKTRKQQGGNKHMARRLGQSIRQSPDNGDEPAAAGAGAPRIDDTGIIEKKPLTRQPIWWLIEALGTDNVMESIIRYYNPKLRYGTDYVIHQRTSGETPDSIDKHMLKHSGLAFYGKEGASGHWKAFVKKGRKITKKDPYKVCVQQDGTHGFCQTFSMMLFLNKKLEHGVLDNQSMCSPLTNNAIFEQNTKLALEFILEAVINSEEVSRNIINELPDIIHETKEYAKIDAESFKPVDNYVIGISLNNKSICIKNMTQRILIEFLKSMIHNHKMLSRLLLLKITRHFIREHNLDNNERWYIENGEECD